MVLVPALLTAQRLVNKLRRDGLSAALYPGRVGAPFATGVDRRGHTFGGMGRPCPTCVSVMLVDEHDEVWQQESAPTWHAARRRDRTRPAG